MCLFLPVARKSDQWFAVDPATGVKLHSFTPDGVLGTCPILTSPAGTLYIGRSGKDIPVLHTVCGRFMLYKHMAHTRACARVCVCMYICTHMCASAQGTIVSQVDRTLAW